MQLQGKEIVLTGKVLGEVRGVTSQRIAKLGGTTADKVTASTSLVVVVGNPATCPQTVKFKTAKKLGIPIIGDVLFGNILSGSVTFDQALRSVPQPDPPAVSPKAAKSAAVKATKQINALVRESAKAVDKSAYAVGF